MAEYIRREDAVYVINSKCYELKGLAKNITKGVQELPPANVAPVVHGRWIKEYRAKGQVANMCTECGGETGRASKFCPNCGAKMDGEE